jgi:hypothetical protein
MLSRDWIDHPTSDRYLTETGFRELYGADCARRRDDPDIRVHGSLVDLVWQAGLRGRISCHNGGRSVTIDWIMEV